jgi:hypothetical protein
MIGQWLAEQTLCGEGQEVVVMGVPRTLECARNPNSFAYFKYRVAVAGKQNIKEES